MLSINPISFNQKNRQNRPNFKGSYILTGSDVEVARIALAKKIFKKQLSNVKLTNNGSSSLWVEYPSDILPKIRKMVDKLITRYQLTLRLSKQ